MRALVIDDSRAIRSVLTKMLKECGFEVFEAGHGLEGLTQLQRLGTVDLALVDWNMPEMNGYQFVCAVRANAAYSDLRLMMVTTESELTQMVSALQAGADEYVMKPFTKEVIFEKLSLLGLSVPV
jgi:two-component system chemotaxis response regulator CheY